MYTTPQGSRHSGSGQPPINPPYQQPYPNFQPQPQTIMNPNPGRPAQPYPAKNLQLPQPPSLIQPPALNVQENINTNSQFLPQRGGGMAVSNNEHQQFEGYHNQEEEGGWNQQEHIASVFWEQRCITMLDRFQWFFQRFQILRDEYVSLSEQMQKMDSQQEWHHFQQHHDDFHQKIIEMEQELAAVVGENQQLLQQKMEHDNESIWEQRYQQLLGNFKSLQEEMAHMEANGGGGGGGVPPEQYHQLEDQFNELEYQYGEVVKELQNQQGNLAFQEQLEMQINEYREEIDSYKNNFENLHNENVELQTMIVDLQNQNQTMAQKVGSTVDRSKFEELASLIEQKEREIQAMQNQFKSRNNSQQGELESALNEKNVEIQELRRLLTAKDREREQEISRYENVIEEQEQMRAAHQQKIRQLEKTISSFQSKKEPDSSVKVENLEKKLNYSNQEIANLNETLKSKNQELTELRSLSYQMDKLKEIQSSYNEVVDDRNRMAESLKKKHGEIDAMHKEIQNLTLKLQEVSNKRQEYSTRNLMAEIEDLNDYIRRNEGEIAKLKNIIELKEEYCLKLEEDIRKISEKYITTEQTLFLQRDNWKEQEIKLSSKNLEHEKRLKNLDYEFNLHLKQTLEKEIKGLRGQLGDKQESIRAMEEKEIILSSQLAVFEKQKWNFDQDMALLKKKEKELEQFNETQTRLYKELETTFSQKEEELETIKLKHINLNSQLNASKNQEQELNSVIRNKNKKIEELQKQVAEYVGKSEGADRLKNENAKLKIALEAAQEEADRFRVQGESRMKLSKATSSNVKLETDKQDNAMIAQLQQENRYLKEEVSKMLSKLSLETHKELYSQKAQKQQSPRKEPFEENEKKTKYLNKRLNEFNFKLQSTINQKEGPQGLQHSRSQQLVTFWEQERQQLIQKYEAELNRLKKQLKSQKLGNSQLTENSGYQSPGKQGIRLEEEKLRQQNDFFKEKNRELESRVQNLIRINEELREKIDSVIKLKKTVTTSEYYKEQNKALENENEGLKIKVKKLAEENKEMKIELLTKNSKISQQYEFKMLELELVVQDLRRKVTLLQAGQPKIKEEPPSSKYNFDINLDDLDLKKPSFYKRQSNKAFPQPDSPKKYTGIQQQFQSVLGNLNSKPYESRYGTVNLSSYSYGASRQDYPSRLQRE